MTATKAAVEAFRRIYESPGTAQQGAFVNRSAYFDLLWAYYSNSAFDAVEKSWQAYRSRYGLYRYHRSIYNPTRRLVDFYAGQVYPGVLSEDGSKLPQGVALAIPLAEDTPPALRSAIGQFWQWSNWQSGKSVMVRYGAATGSVLVEVVDDVDRQKVTANVVWPGNVTDLRLDTTGNVKAYTLEFQAVDEQGQPYTFKKQVDQDTIRRFRDDRPFEFNGAPAVEPNPYGFAPAVWAKHKDLGGDHGAPAIHGSIGKVDELNGLASLTHDQIRKVIAAPFVIFAEGGKGGLEKLIGGQTKRGGTDEFSDPNTDKESILMLAGPAGGRVDHLAGNLDLSGAQPYMDKLIGEIEQDHPELAMWRELRAMSQVTGPAAGRLMGDVSGALFESAANYDQQSIKLFQMCVAIAGWRIEQGDWGPGLTRQQEKFRGFNLDSYQRGDLDFAIEARPIIPLTESETMDLERKSLALEGDRNFLASGGDNAIEARLRAGAQGAA